MATRKCPQCGSQYVASVRRCIDCDVVLVDEVDPDAPERTSQSSPLGDGDQIAYELEGWGNPLKVALEGMLDRAGIRRVWESGALVVPAANEEEVDQLVATVEGGEIVEELDDELPQVAFEIEGLDADELADLDARLIAAHIAHAWDTDGALLVGEPDDETVSTIIEEVLAGPVDEVDGLAAQEALSALYVAVDKLQKDPTDAKLVSRYLLAADGVVGLPVPYGLSGQEWQSLGEDAASLADFLRPGDAEPDDAPDADDEATGDESADDDPEPDTEADEGEGGGADADAEGGPGGAPVADEARARARALRTRLGELV